MEGLKSVLGYLVLFLLVVSAFGWLFRKQIKQWSLKRYHAKHLKKDIKNQYDCQICKDIKQSERENEEA